LITTFTPGIRYEDITNSLNYGTNDVSRAGTALAKANNKTNVWIPGLGILCKISDDYNIFTSVHKGSRNQEGEDAENSLNTELGFRFDRSITRRSQGITTISRICKVLILCLAVRWNR
jgi:Fe(3+) dicitrate transport protein